MMPPSRRDLVLIGGGHSHALVLRQLGDRPIPGVRLTLISGTTHTPYSGMLPGYIAGHYGYDEVHIDLRRLAEFAGARYCRDEVIGIDRAAPLVWSPEDAEAAANPVVIAGQGDRLRRSACFTQSGGQMRCTSCHDPHAPAATDDKTWFRMRCQKCHGPEACTRKPEHGDAGPNPDCVSCHMERVGSSDVPHAYGTDHWIRRSHRN